MSTLTRILKVAYSEEELRGMKHRRNLDPEQTMLVGLKDHMYRNPDTFEPRPVSSSIALGANGALLGGMVGGMMTPTGSPDTLRNAGIGAGVGGAALGVLGYLLVSRKRDQFRAGQKSWQKA